ncbi:MAG TPA: hypothetical protein VIM79_09200 [Niastella sp.]
MQLKFGNRLNLFLINTNTLSDVGNPYSKKHRLLLYSAFALLFTGLRLWVINTYGNATPFFDQWNGEASGLYKPFVDGTLSWNDLLRPHNEHNIFIPRLLALTLFYLNKGWNPMLQMVVNVAINLGFVLLINRFFIKAIGYNFLPLLLAFSLLLIGLPFGWENILVGFQSAFYLSILFSICALWFIVVCEPFSGRWWLGVVFGILAYLSLASGTFSFAAAAAVSFIFYITKLRRTNKQLWATVVLGALFITGALLTPHLAHQDVYKAHRVVDFYHALKVVFGWPVHWNLLAVIIRNLPIALFAIYIFKKLPTPADAKWFLFAFSLWTVSQVTLIAYARAAGVLAPRYKDLHMLPVILSLACALFLAQTYTGKRRTGARIGLFVWVVTLVVSICNNGLTYLPGELASKHQWDLRSEKTIAHFISTGDVDYLKGQSTDNIPDGNPESLVNIISLPGIKEILPANISHPLKPIISNQSQDAFIVNGYHPKTAAPIYPSWGSYTLHGDTTVGQIALRFQAANIKGRKIEIPVSGNPLSSGIKLEIEQNGKRQTLTFENKPDTTWLSTYVRMTADTFTIHITDASTTEWVAVGTPFALGRLDGVITRILNHYPDFIIFGIVIFFVLITYTSVRSNKQND